MVVCIPQYREEQQFAGHDSCQNSSRQSSPAVYQQFTYKVNRYDREYSEYSRNINRNSIYYLLFRRSSAQEPDCSCQKVSEKGWEADSGESTREKQVWIEPVKPREIVQQVIHHTHIKIGVIGSKFDPWPGEHAGIWQDYPQV